MMRRGSTRTYLVVLVFIISLLVVLFRITRFVNIFFEHSGIAVTQHEIKAAYGAAAADSPEPLIPRIVHQVFHSWRGRPMPLEWEGLRQSCAHLNPDWEYRLWTAKTSHDFIKTHYPWFITTYEGYRYPVQRVDAVRYFLLRHFGGIYLDLDNGCIENLDALRLFPSWTTDGGRGALSNNILGSVPNHPFWVLLTDSLIPYNWGYIFPYVTISYASGQWFETEIWEKYHRLPSVTGNPGNRLHRIMMDDRPGTEPWIYFTQGHGGSWVNWDNYFFLWIGEHLLALALAGVALVALGGLLVRKLFKRRNSPGSNDTEEDGLVGALKRREVDG